MVLLAVDGAFWEYFASDADLLQAFSSHLQFAGIQVEARQLGDCSYL